MAALAEKSCGCNSHTLHIAYHNYIRSLFDCSASIYSIHVVPAVRVRLEVEQSKCARVITGCIKLTNKHVLTAEASLPPLSVRAQELAGLEHEHQTRLPRDDPAPRLTDLTSPLRFPYAELISTGNERSTRPKR